MGNLTWNPNTYSGEPIKLKNQVWPSSVTACLSFLFFLFDCLIVHSHGTSSYTRAKGSCNLTDNTVVYFGGKIIGCNWSKFTLHNDLP